MAQCMKVIGRTIKLKAKEFIFLKAKKNTKGVGLTINQMGEEDIIMKMEMNMKV